MNERNKIIGAWLVVALVFVLVLVAACVEQGESEFGAQAARERFGEIIAKRAVIKNDIEVDTIGEYGDGQGVTIDSLLIKDGGLGAGFSISGAITPTRLFVDGASDASQLVVQGYTTQTNNLLTLEQSDGTDAFTVNNDGDVTTMGDLEEALAITGEADEVQLGVTGYTTQTSDLVQLDGGLVDIGGGSYANADGDNDLGVAGDLEVDGDGYVDGDFTVSGTCTGCGGASGDISVDNIDASESVTVTKFLIQGTQSLAVTNGGQVTATHTVVHMTSSGAVTPTLPTSGVVTGTILILMNNDSENDTITFEDTPPGFLAGDFAMNTTDMLVVYCSSFSAGSPVWVELSRSDN
jgi:hypothetical protein